MKPVPSLLAVLCLVSAGCGGGGPGSSSSGTFIPQSQTITYNGQFYNSANQVLGTATVQITGTSLNGMLVPSGPYSTVQVDGTVQPNGNLLPNGNGATLGEVFVSGKQLQISSIPDYSGIYGVMHVSASS